MPRGRRDHLLPRSYLDGFTNPATPGRLSVYGIGSSSWFESRPASVAFIKGYDDYSLGSTPDQTADQAFSEFESRFPNLRRELVAGGFSGWRSHLAFLLAYANMLRARSELFRSQTLAELSQHPGIPDIARQDLAITKMRMYLRRGTAFFSKLHWCLRLTRDSADPVITGDDAVIVEGQAPSLEGAVRDERTLVFFPVCWQACLIGSPANFDVETDMFHPQDLRMVRSHYLRGRCRFVYSPVRLEP